jgi:hypothetical protein
MLVRGGALNPFRQGNASKPFAKETVLVTVLRMSQKKCDDRCRILIIGACICNISTYLAGLSMHRSHDLFHPGIHGCICGRIAHVQQARKEARIASH